MENVAERVISRCGGVQVVADLLGIETASVHKWKYPRSRGGTGGVVPTSRQQDLLSRARAAGIDLTPADFFDLPRPAPNPAEAA